MATATVADAAELSMKLLIDRKAQRVLFAEASKEVVDFLFSLLALPVAAAVKLVGKEAMAGCCVGNLYASVDKLGSTTSVLTGAARDALLCPAVTSPAAAATTGTSSDLLRLAPAPAPPLFQGTVTSYTVTDDLTVAPAVPVSPTSSIAMLKTFAVKDLGDVQEMTVQLGHHEGLAILKSLLQSKSTVLTDVFLHGNNNNNKHPVSSTPIIGTSSGNNKQAVNSTPIVGGSSGHQDGVAGPAARETRERKPSSRVFGQQWSNYN